MIQRLFRSVVASAVAILLCGTVNAAILSGTISSDITLGAASGPHVLQGEAVIAPGVTVTLQAGALLRAEQYAALHVRGALRCEGTGEQPVVMAGLSAGAGFWQGLTVTDGGSAVLAHARLEDAGYYHGRAILHDGGGSLAMTDSVVRRVSGNALVLGSNANLSSTRSLFEACSGGVLMHPNATFDDAEARFVSTGSDVTVQGGWITRAVAWGLDTHAFELEGAVAVGTGGELTVRPGTTVKARQHVDLSVRGGSLVALGEAARPVVFTDLRDDTAGGDTNRDGSGSSPGAGWWTGIIGADGGSLALRHVSLRYAGYYHGRGLALGGIAGASIIDTTIREGFGNGVDLYAAGGAVSFVRCTFADNTGDGLKTIGSAVLLDACRFTGNDGYGLHQDMATTIPFGGHVFADNGIAAVGVIAGSRSAAWDIERGAQDGEFVVQVEGAMTIDAGTTVVVRPGVTIRFVQYGAMTVLGRLEAVGGAAGSVVFRGSSATAGWWTGIDIGSPGEALLEGVVIRDAGYYYARGLYFNSSASLVLRDSTIDTVFGTGLVVAGQGSFTGARNGFARCGVGANVHPNAGFVDPDSVFVANSRDFELSGGSVVREVAFHLPPTVAAEVTDGISVYAGGRLAFLPGTTVKARQYGYLTANGGTIVADGTAALPVTFTEVRDDTVAGDTNRDGSASAPGPGFWWGIDVVSGGALDMRHAALRHAGYYSGYGIWATQASSVVLLDSRFESIATRGVAFGSNPSATSLRVERCTFSGNTGIGLEIVRSEVTCLDNLFVGNGTFGVRLGIVDAMDFAKQEFAGNGIGAVVVEGGQRETGWTWGRGVGTDRFEIHVESGLTMRPGASLRVAPGVEVVFRQYGWLEIRGSLHAEGEADRPVVFRGVTATPGWWYGINLEGDGSATLARAEIRHAGYYEGYGLVHRSTGALAMTDCLVASTSGDALRLRSGAAPLTLARNRVEGADRGVRMDPDVTFVDKAMTLDGVAADIWVDAGTIRRATRWDAPTAVAMHLLGDVGVDVGHKLTIDAGTNVKCSQYMRLIVTGQIEARGEAGSPVVFTSVLDDTFGGDSNRDGAATTPAPGWWWGIDVRDGGSAELLHAVVAHAGYYEGFGLRLLGGGTVRLESSEIRNHAGIGFVVADLTGTIVPVVRGTRFASNAKAGVRVAGGTLDIQGSLMELNGEHGAIVRVGDAFDFAANTFVGNGLASVLVESGSTDRDVRWSRGQGDPFTIEAAGDLTWTSEGSLVIESGIAVKFRQYAGLWMNGPLGILGEAEAPVLLGSTTDVPGYWSGVALIGGATGTVRHARFRNGDYYYGGMLRQQGDGALDLRDSVFENAADTGLRLSTGAPLVVQRNRFSGCAHGVKMVPAASFDDLGATFSGCAVDVLVQSGAVGPATTWGLPSSTAFRFEGSVTGNEGSSLTLRAGTVVKVAAWNSLSTAGAVVAEGQPGRPVVFTSLQDDEHAGDTNRDGAATMAAPGDWYGLDLFGSGVSDLAFAKVLHAGQYYGIGVHVRDQARLRLAGALLARHLGAALRVSGDGAHLVEGSAFTGSATGIFVAGRKAGLNVRGSSFAGNSEFGVNNTSAGVVDARGSWWGSVLGPRHASNPAGDGSVVSDNVLFSPYAGGPPHALTVAAHPVVGGAVVVDPLRIAYEHGSEVTLTATASEGMAFSHWSGDASGTVNPLAVTMDTTKAITAVFVPTGGLDVLILPAEVMDTALWSIDGVRYLTTAQSLDGIPAGLVAVGFSEVPGWITPSPVQVEILAGTDVEVIVNYTRDPANHFATWAMSHAGLPEHFRGVGDDFDLDGLTNLVEYLLDRDPLTREGGMPWQLTRTAEGFRAELTVRRRLDLDLSFETASRPDSSLWLPVEASAHEAIPLPDPDLETHRVTWEGSSTLLRAVISLRP